MPLSAVVSAGLRLATPRLPGALPGAPTSPAPSTAPPVSLPTDQIDPAQGSKALPGGDFLHQLAQGIGSWALIAAVVGIFVGGVIWAFGSYSQNYQQAYNGRKGVLVSGLAALLVGAGPFLVNFFYSAGHGIHS